MEFYFENHTKNVRDEVPIEVWMKFRVLDMTSCRKLKLPTFRRALLPPSSGSKQPKKNKKMRSEGKMPTIFNVKAGGTFKNH
jgi:hypothetical protein